MTTGRINQVVITKLSKLNIITNSFDCSQLAYANLTPLTTTRKLSDYITVLLTPELILISHYT